MARYNGTPIFSTKEDLKRRFVNVKYPSIPLAFDDTYVYVSQGDRYDTLALSFYNDSSLWWIINRANPSQPSDSLYPNVGFQIRIPSPQRAALIVSQYETLNGIR
jgi:hypothetical protein